MIRLKILALLFCFLSSLHLAHAKGGCGAHGGDADGIEFYSIGKHLVEELKTIDPQDFKNLPESFSLDQLEYVVENTRIDFVDLNLWIDCRKVDAINYTREDPLFEPYIEVNRPRWVTLKNEQIKKTFLVLHEYLGIVEGLYESGEWDRYQMSVDLLSLYQSNKKEKNTFQKKIINSRYKLLKNTE